MANFRGLIYFFFRSDQSSGAVITFVDPLRSRADHDALGWEKMGRDNTAPNNKDEFDLAFANTVLFALLVSYHLNPHDLSLLLLPIALLFGRGFGRTPGARNPANWITLGWVGILFLPPLHLWTLRAGVYALMSLPLLGLFSSLAFLLRREETRAVKLTAALSDSRVRRCAPCTARRISAKTKTGKLNVAKNGTFQELIAHARHPSK